MQASRPIARGLGAWTPFLVCSMRAASEPTESLGGSAPEISKWCTPRGPQASRLIRSGARHQGTTEGYQPIYGNISSNLVNFKAMNKSMTLCQEIRVTDSLTLHS